MQPQQPAEREEKSRLQFKLVSPMTFLIYIFFVLLFALRSAFSQISLLFTKCTVKSDEKCPGGEREKKKLVY